MFRTRPYWILALCIAMTLISCRKAQENTPPAGVPQPAPAPPPCVGNSTITNGCLLTKVVTEVYEYRADTLSGQVGGISNYLYEARRLAKALPPTGPKSAPFTRYEYNDRDQLIRTVSGNAAPNSIYYTTTGDYLYGSDCKLLSIAYNLNNSEANTKTPTGRDEYSYGSNHESVRHLDTSGAVLSTDSTVFNSAGIPVEKWVIRNGSYTLSTFINHDKAHPFVPRAGDVIREYSGSALTYTTTVDSVFLNQYGYDTLWYASGRNTAGTLQSIRKVKSLYEDCR